ncbi:hypothetical protein D3C78_1322360 [compost metagenome]
MKHEIALLVHRLHLPGDDLVLGIDLGLEGQQVGAIALRIARIPGAQRLAHRPGDHQRLGWSQPDMGIHPFVMVPLVPVMIMAFMLLIGRLLMPGLLAVVEQRHALDPGQGQHMGMLGQRLGHEAFQLRADPHHQISLVDAANVGRAQGEVVGGGAGRQQHLGFTHAVGDGSGNETERFDGG